MSFDLTVVFTGVMAFVKNSNAASKAKMCVLVPNAAATGRMSQFDGQPLLRHVAFVRFPIANVSGLDGVYGQDSLGLWYLTGQRLFIETAPTPGSTDMAPENAFNIKRLKLKPGQEHPSDALNLNDPDDSNSFSWALNMRKVCSGFQVDRTLLGDQATADQLAAQIFLDSGTVSAKTLTNAVWTFDSWLNPGLATKPYTRVLAQEVMVFYKGIDAARIKAISLDGTSRTKYLDLTSLQRDGQLQITIDNTCDDNPLEWPRDDAPQPDQDTRWIYELLSPGVARDVKATLAAQGRPLPIPTPVPGMVGGIGSPGSGNCIPPRVDDAPFVNTEMDGKPAAEAEEED